MQFEWNIEKALFNLRKHRVNFIEAQTVFDDPLAKTFDDEAHSQEEKRELIVGRSVEGRLLIVSFTERRSDIIRVISARDTTPKERKDYENAE